MIKNYRNPIAYLSNELLRIVGNDLVSIVIFGSRARKNYNESSDIDVMMVLENQNFNEKALSKLRKDYLLKTGISLDLHIFSKEEIIANFNDFSPLFLTLLLGKIILFDKEMFFHDLYKNFIKRMINQNIRYCEGGKIWELNKIAESLEALQ